jgi:hypothetical protein
LRSIKNPPEGRVSGVCIIGGSRGEPMNNDNKRRLASIAIGVICASFLTACATQSGILPIGDGAYTASRQGGSAFTSPAELTTESIKEATQYCGKQNKSLQVLTTKERAAGLGQFPQSEVFFKCAN